MSMDMNFLVADLKQVLDTREIQTIDASLLLM